MKILLKFLIPIALFHVASSFFLSSAKPEWTGKGKFRILVNAKPVNIGNRSSDEMPARFSINFAKLLADSRIIGEVDLSSLQVHKYNLLTGGAEKFKPFESAISEYDRPCRFDDNTMPEDFPSYIGNASSFEDGRPPVTISKRKARLFDREMDNSAGEIIWIHTQKADQTSQYAIYFDVRKTKEETGPGPSPWIGDVDVLRKKEGQILGRLPHFTTAVGDLNGDGLFDIVAGAEKGDLIWYPNHGSLGKPKFTGCKMLTDEKGPIGVGWYAAPFLYDWNNDGLLDLIIGTSRNVILWWKNTGTKTEFKLSYMGFIKAGEKRLEVPQSPVPEDTKDIFKEDYYNQPWVGDWNGDGLPDILTGGYTTGLIFSYLATGRDANGIPVLKYAGSIKADGKPIDATWAAAPTAYDFDADGKLELMTGSWWWSGIPYPPKPGQISFLMYYKNSGTMSNPVLSRLPVTDQMKGPDISRVNVVDWDNDGLPDLLVKGTILYINEGTANNPKWPQNGKTMNIPWGVYSAPAIVGSMVKMKVNGVAELIANSYDGFYAITGSIYSPEQKNRGTATANGKAINHPGPGYGDEYYFTSLSDWDNDGKADLLWGTHQGNIYLHKSLGDINAFNFDEGIKLKLLMGEDLKVGPAVVNSPSLATDFTILQGSRIRFTVNDFDGDGIKDLAITDTYGFVWIFLNTKAGGTNTFLPGIKVAKFPKYVFGFNSIDWNGDNKTDIIASGTSSAPGQLLINNSKPGQPSFSEPYRPKELQNLPHVFWGPDFSGADWNKDGDDDLMIQSEFLYNFWAERSFLEHGYCEVKKNSELQRHKK